VILLLQCGWVKEKPTENYGAIEKVGSPFSRGEITMSNNESIDIKDINTTTELSQEEMDEVKGGAISGGGGTSTTPSTITTGGTGGTTSGGTSGITKGTSPT
jgi:hypothetical protein